jgi:ParB family chromosome partitioning protein
VRKFFPKDYTTAQMQAVILKLLDEYQRKRQRDLAR